MINAVIKFEDTDDFPQVAKMLKLVLESGVDAVVVNRRAEDLPYRKHFRGDDDGSALDLDLLEKALHDGLGVVEPQIV